MLAFRITQAPFADLSGKGGLYASARWHTRGRPIVYSAPTRSLSILETLVHTDPEDVPDNLVLLTLDVPDDISVHALLTEVLPADWQAPLHPGCQAIGDQWLASGMSAVLLAPCALVSEEANLLINPLHPEAPRIQIVEQRPFAFDERLLEPVVR